VGKLARRTGWIPRAHEDLVGAANRRNLLGAAADLGRDPIVGPAATKLARRWLDDHAVLPKTLWGVTLRTAVHLDDGTLFDLMLPRLATEPDIAAQRALASALGETLDPARLQRGLAYVAAQPTIAPQLLYIFWGAERPDTIAALLAFLSAHVVELLAKVPEDARTNLAPWTCLAEHRDAVIALLDAHFVSLPGYSVSSRDRDVVTMDACIALRAAQAKPLAEYLAKHR